MAVPGVGDRAPVLEKSHYPDRSTVRFARAAGAVLRHQSESGFWCYEFEADCTIPAEYLLMRYFLDEPALTDGLSPDLERRMAAYLRARQNPDGGWALYAGGQSDLSCTVKVYYALKLVGDSPDSAHMSRARRAVLERGGAARANVFTRITLALFEQVPWHCVPVVPVELILFPRWTPFSYSKVSYWTRTVAVPLSILCSRKARARNPGQVGIGELLARPEPEPAPVSRSFLARVFLGLDRLGRWLEPHVPRWLRRWAERRAEVWMVERLNGEDGLGAIFPAMVNAYESLVELGYPEEHPLRRTARAALQRLVVVHPDEAYCQPCLSPVWDTALACLALNEAADQLGRSEETREIARDTASLADIDPAIERVLERCSALPLCSGGASPSRPEDAPSAVRTALDWLADRQLTEAKGDWTSERPGLAGGGWPFEFGNDHYPDVDDTAAVGWAMQLVDPERYREPVVRAARWVAGMQSSNGGFGAFAADNTHYYLNEIPFADHGALLDPPTSDVTARCIAFLSLADGQQYAGAIDRALGFLAAEQEPEGCWFGRWGTNYVYGTWSVLTALELLPEALRAPLRPAIERGADWLEQVQRPDGGWGESNDSYLDRSAMGRASASTSFHTAWALLALLAAGRHGSPGVARGVEYLESTQRADGSWYDDAFTCPGFPRVFYLKYHGYSKYFPLWALARHRKDSEWSDG